MSSTKLAAAQQNNPDGSVQVAYCDEQHRNRLAEILDGATPKEFRWVSFVVDSTRTPELSLPSGLIADLHEAKSGVTFTQVYPGPCNPALGKFDDCWLFEELRPGALGVSGTVALRVESETVSGEYDTTFDGLTDRFGDPVQQLHVETVGNFEIRLDGGGQ